jgi:hypothetical protein
MKRRLLGLPIFETIFAALVIVMILLPQIALMRRLFQR